MNILNKYFVLKVFLKISDKNEDIEGRIYIY
jgi:hypothetical protein